MQIGNQIKILRRRRGVTQEALAQHLGVTPQAVSKWERGVAVPDIAILPDISAFFGVTIDSLFAIDDETHMERIQNMLWDVRYLPQSDVDAAREFLLDKSRREPNNGKPLSMLAEMENYIAKGHHDLAAEYAMEALRRDHKIKTAHSELTRAMNGVYGDWCAKNHYELIEYYKEFVTLHPDYVSGYLWLLDQLFDDNRLDEAEIYCQQLEKIDCTFRSPYYRGMLHLLRGDQKKALEIFREMEQKFSNDWLMYLSLGDVMVRIGNYEQAVICYRKYNDNQKSPRYTDALTSISQLCEIRGDYAGAIAAAEEEIAVLASDWDTTCGETVDQLVRKIERLKKKL